MTEYEVRRARTSDLERVAEIEGSSPFSPGWNVRQFEGGIGRLEACFSVAEEAGRTLGFILWKVCPPEADLLDLGVDLCARRRGVGRLLLMKGVEELRLLGVETLHLEVHEANEAALGLYRSAGFRVVGSRRNFYNGPGGSAAALLMELKP